jgi:hypothetical protein
VSPDLRTARAAYFIIVGLFMYVAQLRDAFRPSRGSHSRPRQHSEDVAAACRSDQFVLAVMKQDGAARRYANGFCNIPYHEDG